MGKFYSTYKKEVFINSLNKRKEVTFKASVRANFPYPLENYVRISLGLAKKLSTFYEDIQWKKSNFI